MAIEVPTSEGVKVPDGLHKGQISRIGLSEERVDKNGDPYRYIELFIKPADIPKIEEMRYSCTIAPGKKTTDTSKLGKLLISFGANKEDFKKEKKLLVEDFIKAGQNVVFQTITPKDKKFAEIVEDSVKPDGA